MARTQEGKLVVVDGSDGVGKKTQVALLTQRLMREGVRVKTLDFPQYEKNFFGSLIKRSLAGEFGNFIAINPYYASLLYAADRFESKHTLEDWLARGYVVVLDRYVSANQMHQGGKIKHSRERMNFLAWLDTLEHETLGIPRPNLVLYLHLPVLLSLKLLREREAKTSTRKRDLAERNQKHLEQTQRTAIQYLRRSPEWRKIVCFDKNGVLPRNIIHEIVYSTVQEIL